MHREYHRWHSPSLGREMELLILGHAGARVLAFPSSMGRFYEWEDRGMASAVGEHLANGWLQLYCVDSVDDESWYAKWKHPADRAWRHTQYEDYLRNEVIPLSVQRNANPYLIVTGASFGAFHAMNFALRHPGLVGRVLAMSGLYDVKENTGGYSDERVRYHNPAEYLPVMSEHGEHMAAIRRMDIIMAVGREDPNICNNEWFSGELWKKGVWHALRVWDGWCHDWAWWQGMVRAYIGGA